MDLGKLITGNHTVYRFRRMKLYSTDKISKTRPKLHLMCIEITVIAVGRKAGKDLFTLDNLTGFSIPHISNKTGIL